MTYHYRDPQPNEKCHDCGEDATIVLVSDSQEPETGYTDELPLCEDCAERRDI